MSSGSCQALILRINPSRFWRPPSDMAATIASRDRIWAASRHPDPLSPFLHVAYVHHAARRRGRDASRQPDRGFGQTGVGSVRVHRLGDLFRGHHRGVDGLHQRHVLDRGRQVGRLVGGGVSSGAVAL
ncbi:hypothetical protein [Nonomuraea sp. NPDC005650]|uniref:hypothetical protein n=1 Tax=Nonomuraea sp. NPDC005650 TaxID=3157045 RepID=UPI0033B8CA60